MKLIEFEGLRSRGALNRKGAKKRSPRFRILFRQGTFPCMRPIFNERRNSKSLHEAQKMRLIEFEGLRLRGIPQGKTQIWRLVCEGKFPRPVKVGSRNAWVESEIDAYIAERIAARDGATVEAV
jgi:prophage regulatory protein